MRMPIRSGPPMVAGLPDGRAARAFGMTFVRCCTLICGLLATAPQPIMAEENRLSRPEARALATSFLRQDQPMAAHALALGLLEVDARDYDALMVLSRAEVELGRPKKSEIAARRACRVGQNTDEKLAAA